MDKRKLGFGLIGAGVLVLGSLLVGQFGGGSSEIDERILDQIREKYVSGAVAGEDMKPSVQVSQSELTIYTEDDLLNEVEVLLEGGGDPYEVPDDFPNYNHQSLAVAANSWDMLSEDAREKLEPYMKKPTDPDSFFHISNWEVNGGSSAFLDGLKNLFGAEVAYASNPNADEVNNFADASGYEYFESPFYDIRVYFPGVDMVPSSSHIHDDASSHVGADVAEQNYSYLHYKALEIMIAANKAYPEFTIFFGSPLNQSMEIYVVDSIVSGASGLTLDCQRIYVPHTSPDFQIDSITAHEMFHCFQHDKNISQPNLLEIFIENITTGNRRQWVSEGGSVFGQYLADMPYADTHYFFKNYAANPGNSLFDRSYNAVLFWHELYDEFGESTASAQMMAYQGAGDNEQQAQMLQDKFHQIALNVSDTQELYDDGTATRPIDDEDIPLNTAYVEADIEGSGTIHPFSLNLQEMSINYFDFLVLGQGSLVRFDFGDEINQGEEDVEISAVIYSSSGHTYEKVELQEDDDDNKYVIFCLTDNDICEAEGRQKHDGLYRIKLIVTNRSGTNKYTGNFLGTLFGPDPYKAFQVVMNEGDLEVPVTGKLHLTIDLEEGEMRMEARKFWLKFDSDFYDWDSIEVPESPNVSDVEIHPSRLTNYVNNFCHFRGYIDFDFELLSESDENAPWLTRKFKLKKTDQGNFYVMKHKFACKMDPEMFEILGVNGPAVVVLQVMFSKINTTDYPDGSFAMNMHRLFKEFMTLGLWADTEGEVEMQFIGDDTFEAIKIEFNDNLHLYFDKES